MSGALKRDKWETVRLGDVCDIYTGTGFPVQYQGEKTGVFPFYKVGDISRNVSGGNVFLGNCDNFISEDVAKILKGTIIPKDTVVFAKIGEAVKLNRRAVTVQDCLVDNNAMGVCPNQARVFLSYFYHYMCHLRLETYAESTTVPSVKKSVIEMIKIPLPPLYVQRRIADTLDKVSELITLRKTQLKKLDELVKARFVEMFANFIQSGNELFLEEISIFVTVGIANSATHAYTVDGIVMLRNQNIKENYLDTKDLIYITDDFAKKYRNKQLVENDILVIRTGYPGVACLVPKKYSGCQTFTTLIVRLKDSSYAHANYVCHYINSSFGKEYVEQSKVGVAQQNFGAKVLAKMPIVLPPLSLQNSFASFVSSVEEAKAPIQQSLDALETLKKSLMQEYFG